MAIILVPIASLHNPDSISSLDAVAGILNFSGYNFLRTEVVGRVERF